MAQDMAVQQLRQRVPGLVRESRGSAAHHQPAVVALVSLTDIGKVAQTLERPQMVDPTVEWWVLEVTASRQLLLVRTMAAIIIMVVAFQIVVHIRHSSTLLQSQFGMKFYKMTIMIPPQQKQLLD